jgi:predicted RNase H-like nuclease
MTVVNDSSDLQNLISDPYVRAMIDVPVGLPAHGYRRCDIEARALVGSRVFLGARWGVWQFKCHQDANEHYWRLGDKGISRQPWCIRDKLKEVNEWMTPDRQLKLLESHPELVFRWLAGRDLDSKKSASGREQRLNILQDYGLDEIGRWLTTRRGTRIGRDDLIDACACALAARDSKNRLPSIKEIPTDPRGIRMEIWY